MPVYRYVFEDAKGPVEGMVFTSFEAKEKAERQNLICYRENIFGERNRIVHCDFLG